VIDPNSTKHSKTIVSYTIANAPSSGASLNVTGVSFTSDPSGLLTGTYDPSSTCGQSNFSVPVGQSCVYAVDVTSGSSTKGQGTLAINLMSNGTTSSSLNSPTILVSGTEFELTNPNEPTSGTVGVPLSVYFTVTNLEPRGGSSCN
jgi:hypothetical protein